MSTIFHHQESGVRECAGGDLYTGVCYVLSIMIRVTRFVPSVERMNRYGRGRCDAVHAIKSTFRKIRAI